MLPMKKCSLFMHIKVVFSNSQKPYGLAYDIFSLCNRIKCRLEICENTGGKALFCKGEGSLKVGIFFIWRGDETPLNTMPCKSR